MNYLVILWIFLISFGINYICFGIAYALKTDAFTDLTYGLSFSLITIIMLAWFRNFSIFQIFIFILINLWALRIGSYLFYRILKIKVDKRFDGMRNSFVKFGMFWTLQALTVFLIVLPAAFALSINASQYLSAPLKSTFNPLYSIMFVLGAVFALGYETVADIQKYLFYQKRKSPQEFIKTGLWSVSRHPNYFGEILFWFMISGIFLYGFWINNHFKTNWYQIFWLISPLYLLLLINFVSGVPLLERKDYRRHALNPDFINYLKVTPCVVPYIGKRGPIIRYKRIDWFKTNPKHRS